MNSTQYKFNKILILTFLIIGFYSCSDDNEDLTPPYLAVSEIEDVAYGTDSDQVYDIYLPAGRSKLTTKTFILIHGGSWISGDKDDMTNFVTLLKTNFPDYAIVNINYRLANVGISPFPMQTIDIQSVLGHLKNNSDTYQIKQKYAFIGASAGAHLAMLYSYKYDRNSVTEMVCSIVGPTNFTDPSYLDDPEYSDILMAFKYATGVDIFENPSFYEDFSPFHAVTEIAPPTILFYGGKDDLVPTSQGVNLNTKLTELDVVHEFIFYENEGHGWTGPNLSDTYTKLVNFTKLHF
ncbi:MAG: alpha/beta hydrolase [Flavobacteriaceae bacterium]|nr:alpha/beta hydrolase [Flavobacteriaceae bacterium]